MKPPPFRYHAPETLDEAVAVLAEVGEDGKVLAGGQSLIPMMNFRLAAPEHLVDVGGVAALDRIEVDDAGVRVHAGVRQAGLERHEEAGRACPLLRQALVHVAHPAVRNRGTVCGSVAHADPAAELPAVLVLLGGTVRLRCADRSPPTRDVPAEAFFKGVFEPDCGPTELVESVAVPRQPARGGTAFVEVARRHGDYALCGAGALVELDADGRIVSARLAFCSVGPTPLPVDVTEVLAGADPAEAPWDAAADRARAAVRPGSDLHASADYRRHLAGVLAVRALRAAVAHARTRSPQGAA